MTTCRFDRNERPHATAAPDAFGRARHQRSVVAGGVRRHGGAVRVRGVHIASAVPEVRTGSRSEGGQRKGIMKTKLVEIVNEWDRYGLKVWRFAVGCWRGDYSEGFVAVFRGCRGLNFRVWRVVFCIKLQEIESYKWVWRFPKGMYKS